MIGLTVIAKAVAKEGKEEALEKQWRAVVDESKREQGCLEYQLLRNQQSPREFLSIERWSSKEDLDEHLASSHVQELLSRVPELIDGHPSINVYADIERESCATESDLQG